MISDYNIALANDQRKGLQSWSQSHSPPKAPSLLEDRSIPNDWHIINVYVDLLRPCKHATMKLQGQVTTTTKDGYAAKGALWQVLLMFEEILKGFEDSRQRHVPSESQLNELQTFQATPSPSQAPPDRRTRTRSSQN